MARAAKKKPAVPMIVFSRARDIPFNRIRESDSNVREIDLEAGLDELAQDIDRREDLVQGLNVRAVLDDDGNETGDFETPAGRRRFRSIARLVQAGRFPEDGLVPCIVKKADAKTSAVDDSLAENVFRVALHPLDQFRAFKRMVDGGMSALEVATAYFTTPRYVEQRLRLATVSPKLLEVYAENGMTLAMLEAFTAHPDHARQDQVWEAIQHSHYREPWRIRQMLTETAVRASDKRALFVGLDAYVAAGGPVLPRYLFDDHDDGWLEDVPLLDKLVADKLKTIADEIAAEGWKWIKVALDLPYAHTYGLRAITGTFPELTRKERKQREAMRDELEQLEAEYAGGSEDLPEEVARRRGEIEAALKAFERRPAVYDPAEIAIAGVFISIDSDGDLVVDRGWVRPEDEPTETVDGDVPEADGEDGEAVGGPAVQRAVITIGDEVAEPEDEEEATVKPLPERLVAELTAHRTVALRDAVGANPHVAMTALLHKLVRDTFRRSTHGSAVQASVREVSFREQGMDLKDSPYAKSVTERHEGWNADLPADDDALWGWLDALDDTSRMALLAHCVSYGINALYERPSFGMTGVTEHGLRRRMAEADRLARATGLDMVEGGFRPTVANYLGRVTKARILEAVAEALGTEKVEYIEHMRKEKMAEEAERLLADTGWLPEPLRLADPEAIGAGGEPGADADTELPAFLADDGEEEAGDTEAEAAEAAMIAAE